MKSKLIILLLVVPLFCLAQTKFEKVNLSVSVPVNLDYEKKTVNFAKGIELIDKKEEQKYIQINANMDDMRVRDHKFSGVSINKFPVGEEIVTINGTYSTDGQFIETMTIDYQVVKYHLPDPTKARLEETKNGSFTFKKIPKGISGYKFDSEKSEISDISWKHYYFVKYVGSSETTNSNFISLNKDAITKYTRCVSLRIRPGIITSEETTYDKVAAVTNIASGVQGDSKVYSSSAKGIMTLLIHKFSQVPGLKVLEREKLDILLREQDLSASGLVAEEYIVESGKMMEEDILVVIHVSDTYVDENGDLTGWLIQPFIIEKASGKIVNPELAVRYNKVDFSLAQMQLHVSRVFSNVMKKYFGQL